MNNLSIPLEFIVKDFIGPAKIGVHFFYLNSSKPFYKSNEISVFVDNQYSQTLDFPSINISSNTLFKVLPYIKYNNLTFFVSPLYYFFDGSSYTPTRVSYTNDLNQVVIERKPKYERDINSEAPKKLVPNPTPQRFERYDAASLFDNQSLTFDNEEDFSPSLETIQISNVTKQSINLLKSSPTLRILKTEVLGYSSIKIDVYFSLKGLSNTYSDFYFLDILLNGKKRFEYPSNRNKEYKSILISNLSSNTSISMVLRYKKRLLKRTNQLQFNNELDKTRVEKIISY